MNRTAPTRIAAPPIARIAKGASGHGKNKKPMEQLIQQPLRSTIGQLK
jgi:hypothetical protein